MRTTNVLKPELVDCPRKELNNKYYFYMKKAVEEEEAVEERRGRGYKEGDRMVEEGDFFLESSREKNFTEEQRKEGDGTEREEN